MNYKQLLALIRSGEGLRVEFKQRFSDYEKIAKEMIAFANTRGGVLIFGVADNGSIYGVDSEKSITELVEKTVSNWCEPRITPRYNYFEIQGLEVVAVEIEESAFKPHRLQDYNKNFDLNSAQVYVRVNDKSVPASKEMIKLLQTQTTEKPLKNYNIGKNEKTVFEFVNENEKISVKELCEIANLSKRRASRTLINMVRANLLILHTKDNGEEYFTSFGL
ncbi:MAG: ATP-binding protein [Melioribacteraceae bacterium]|nr:ATP-binding protein [Melioribacteraceae bacterium]MCF8413952.1 ATP-binding protein [Melioribacteraceae bacterium]MCF8432244.1 ATP-binding protein [Melioribacteraceae bacterium]